MKKAPAQNGATEPPSGPPILLAAAFEAYGLSESIAARFRAKELYSVADVERWLREPTSDGPGEPARFNRLTDIPGVTERQAREIGQALFAASQPQEKPRLYAPEISPTQPQRRPSAMPRLRKTARKERRRVVKIQFIPRPDKKPKTKDPLEPYGYIDRIVEAYHVDLLAAKIAVAWMLDVKSDRDGHLTLGKCRKATDLDREFRGFDFVVLLNSLAWKKLDEKQRAALVDHELCHAAPAEDKNGNPILDERGRKCWRMRKHDIEEFNPVVKRHGMYLSDIAEFVRNAQAAPLFEKQMEAESNGHGEKKT